MFYHKTRWDSWSISFTNSSTQDSQNFDFNLKMDTIFFPNAALILRRTPIPWRTILNFHCCFTVCLILVIEPAFVPKKGLTDGSVTRSYPPSSMSLASWHFYFDKINKLLYYKNIKFYGSKAGIYWPFTFPTNLSKAFPDNSSIQMQILLHILTKLQIACVCIQRQNITETITSCFGA